MLTLDLFLEQDAGEKIRQNAQSNEPPERKRLNLTTPEPQQTSVFGNVGFDDGFADEFIHNSGYTPALGTRSQLKPRIMSPFQYNNGQTEDPEIRQGLHQEILNHPIHQQYRTPLLRQLAASHIRENTRPLVFARRMQAFKDNLAQGRITDHEALGHALGNMGEGGNDLYRRVFARLNQLPDGAEGIFNQAQQMRAERRQRALESLGDPSELNPNIRRLSDMSPEEIEEFRKDSNNREFDDYAIPYDARFRFAHMLVRRMDEDKESRLSYLDLLNQLSEMDIKVTPDSMYGTNIFSDELPFEDMRTLDLDELKANLEDLDPEILQELQANINDDYIFGNSGRRYDKTDLPESAEELLEEIADEENPLTAVLKYAALDPDVDGKLEGHEWLHNMSTKAAKELVANLNEQGIDTPTASRQLEIMDFVRYIAHGVEKGDLDSEIAENPRMLLNLFNTLREEDDPTVLAEMLGDLDSDNTEYNSPNISYSVEGPDDVEFHDSIDDSSREISWGVRGGKLNLKDKELQDLKIDQMQQISKFAQSMGMDPMEAYKYLKEGGEEASKAYEKWARKSAALEAMYLFRKGILPYMDEGSILSNTPIGGNRGGNARERIYSKQGFGSLDDNGRQFGQVGTDPQTGKPKLFPIDPQMGSDSITDMTSEFASENFGGLPDGVMERLVDSAFENRYDLSGQDYNGRNEWAVSMLDDMYQNDYFADEESMQDYLFDDMSRSSDYVDTIWDGVEKAIPGFTGYDSDDGELTAHIMANTLYDNFYEDPTGALKMLHDEPEALVDDIVDALNDFRDKTYIENDGLFTNLLNYLNGKPNVFSDEKDSDTLESAISEASLEYIEDGGLNDLFFHPNEARPAGQVPGPTGTLPHIGSYIGAIDSIFTDDSFEDFVTNIVDGYTDDIEGIMEDQYGGDDYRGFINDATKDPLAFMDTLLNAYLSDKNVSTEDQAKAAKEAMDSAKEMQKTMDRQQRMNDLRGPRGPAKRPRDPNGVAARMAAAADRLGAPVQEQLTLDRPSWWRYNKGN